VDDKVPKPNIKLVPSSPVLECPFSKMGDIASLIRRQDLLDLSNVFRELMGPVTEVLKTLKEQNEVQRETNAYVKHTSKKQARQGAWLIVLALGFIVVSIMQVYFGHMQDQTSHKQEAVIRNNEQVQEELVKVAADLRDSLEITRRAKDGIEDIKENQNSPSVELVAETDPVKAKKAPVKLRILPPRFKEGTVSPEPSAAVELPITKVK
jgi:hypothetical protein